MGDERERTTRRSWRESRFDREYPFERPDDALVERLMERVPAAVIKRLCAGETVRIKRGIGKQRFIRKVGDPAPNAPLLKRLMRNPFATYPVHPRRSKAREPVPWEAVKRQRRESTRDVLEGGRPSPCLGNPMREFSARLAGRAPRLAVEAWLGSRS